LVLIVLWAVVVVYLAEEMLRLSGRRVPGITSFTLKMSRSGEGAHLILRPVCLAVGVILALLLFPSAIAYASIVIVAVGDPVAAFVGGRFCRIHVRKRKTLEGSLAGLIVSFLLASLIVNPAAAFLGAVGAMGMELVDVPDDNLTMPVAAGAMMLLEALIVR
jgi:dolichol kinase